MMPTPSIDVFAGVILACSDYETINVSTTIAQENFQDAVICAYAVRQGLTLPGFGAIVLLGVINLPIYIRQESAIMPFVLTMLIGGLMLSSVASFVQGLAVLLILLVVGLGPVLALRRIDQQ